MANLYRCLYCSMPAGLDFEDDRPLGEVRCPRCSRGVPGVAPRVNVHFIYPDLHGPIVGLHSLRYRIACMPDLPHPNGRPATDMPHLVTCSKCRQHPTFREYEVQGVANAGINVVKSPCE